MDGVMIIDKPQDYTSFDVVAVMRRLSHERKIGHTGTLDPMATGVLPLLLGKATRAASLLEETDKEYEAGFAFGVSTDTQDSTGKVLKQSDVCVKKEELEQALCSFRGEIRQIPPMYSAIRKNGVRLYALARKGIEVEREDRPVTIYKLECTAFDEETRTGRLTIRCSKGTYIRTLCADLAEFLGTVGVMTSLRRTAASGFLIAESITLDEARGLAEKDTLAQRLLPIDQLFSSLPSVSVSEAQARRFGNGGGLSMDRLTMPALCCDGGRFRVYGEQNLFLGLGEISAQERELKVKRLF